MDGQTTTHDNARFGWKFLTPWGTTEEHYTEYPLPAPGEKWGPWFKHPDPSQPDSKDCGPGRWHVMKNPDARYAPGNWWIWFAEARGIIGEGYEKFSCAEIRLRRVRPKTFHRMIRLGMCTSANLRGAYLHGADLGDANLRGADLRDAILPSDFQPPTEITEETE